jgi:hypothetical protein
MGMDLNGRNPTGKRGEYFSSNVWWWHPLAEYCITVAPEICAQCEGWHSNDGDGLDAAGADALAEVLQKEVDSGRTETFARELASAQEQMPDERCDICAGTGIRTPVPLRGAGDLKEGGIMCNKCQGAGYVRPWASYEQFSTQAVVAFIAFLRESGGFSIR